MTEYEIQKTARSFKGIWISKEIWFDQNLTMSEKLFYVEINSLDNADSCYASNSYFAEFFQISKSRVSSILSSLVKKGYIKNKLIYKKGTKEIEKRILTISDPIRENKYTPPTRKQVYPIRENSEDITKYNNILDTKVSIGGKGFPLKQLQIKYNPMLTRTLINIGKFNTGLNKDSKVMQSVYKYLIQLQHNVFLKDKELDKKASLKNRDTYRIDRIMNDKQLEAVLKKAARQWNLMYTDDSYNSPNARPSLDTFFYNPSTGMSYFIYCTSCQLKKRNEIMELNKVDSAIKGLGKIVPNLEELTGKLYNKSIIDNFKPKDQLAFYMNVKNLIEWRIDNKDKLKVANDGWNTLFGTNKIMMSTVARFMQEQGTSYLPNFLVVDGYLWDKFCEWCLESYQVNLNPRRKRK